MRVCIAPTYTGADKGDGGIRRVVTALQQHLPEHDIQVVDDPRTADLVNVHGTIRCDLPGVPVVSSTHGMYWQSYDWDDWAFDANRAVIESLTRAQAITAPSKWVAHAISRGMLARPTVIYHGVDADQWQHNEANLGYVLWNKARTDAVSDPADMQQLAALLSDIPFVSTFGQPMQNVHVTGAVPYEQMRPLVQRAGVYLATARETMGIGTLEALAAGVPVVGWRYGGQEEIIIEGETGYLVEPGDNEALVQAVLRCLEDRKRLSTNAQQDARERWGWQDKIAQYAALFQQVANNWNTPRPKVSIVVTCYNLARFLPDAIASVQAQTMTDWECLIVDDSSTDDTAKVARALAKKSKQIQYLKTPENLKLSGARNYGWQHANGRYILFLDADDMLDPNALDSLATALDHDASIHIAYGHLDTVDEQGQGRQRNPWPFDQFDWRGQMAHLNQLPYAALLRREVLERSGGYRIRDWRAEDAALWCRLTSFGFRARKVTNDATLIYRIRSDSKSGQERQEHVDADGDWTAWFPWRLAGTGQDGVDALKAKRHPDPARVPWGAQGTPPKPLKAWPVRHHQHPAVSVIIPVGPGHAHYVVDALDSLVAQTMPDWEAIVVNDTGKALDIAGHPWARVVNLVHGILGGPDPKKPNFTETGPKGAGFARNVGLEAARAPLVLFLDADDILVPTALERMLHAYVETGGLYVYSDWGTLEDDRRIDGPARLFTVLDYEPLFWLDGMHAVTALVPTEDARRIGFDEQLVAWEDWDFYIKMAVAGVCGVRIPEPLLIYRQSTGTRRKIAEANKDALLAEIKQRYDAYRTGEKQMAGCCGGNKGAIAIAQQSLEDMRRYSGQYNEPPTLPQEGASIRLEFIGETWGAMSYVGRPSNRIYRGGANPSDRYVDDVDPRDVAHLLSLGVWRVVALERQQMPA